MPDATIASGNIAAQMNANGQIAFLGQLDGLDLGGYRSALWATDLEGNLNLIARSGMTIDVDPDPDVEQLKTILKLEVSIGISRTNGVDGRSRIFNDAGQLAFGVIFDDYSHALVVADTTGLGIIDLLEGDLNGDLVVDELDLAIVLTGYGQSVDPGTLLAGDPTGDGRVDAQDFNYILRHFSDPAAAAQYAVPEPATLGLLVIGLSFVARRRHA